MFGVIVDINLLALYFKYDIVNFYKQDLYTNEIAINVNIMRS